MSGTITVDETKTPLISLDFDLANALRLYIRVKNHAWATESQEIVRKLTNAVKESSRFLEECLQRTPGTAACFQRRGLLGTVIHCEKLRDEYYAKACDRRYARGRPGYDHSQEQHDANVELLEEYLWERSEPPSCRIAVEELKVDLQVVVEGCYDIPNSNLPILSASQDIRELPSKKLDATTTLTMRSKVPDELVFYHDRYTRITERLYNLYKESLEHDQDEQRPNFWGTLENFLFESRQLEPDMPNASDEVQKTVDHTLKTLAEEMARVDHLTTSCISLAWDACRARDGSLSSLAQDPRSTAASDLPRSL